MFNLWTYVLVRIGIILRKICGPYVSKLIAIGIGNLAYLLLTKRRGILKENITNILQQKNISSSLVRRSFVYFALNYIDFLGVPSMKKAEIKELVTEVKGLCNLDNALKEGKGVIFITPHIGNWDLGVVWGASMGYQGVAVAESKGVGERFFKLYKKLRGKLGTKILRLEDKDLWKKIIQEIRANKIIFLLGDRDITRHGVKVKFLERQVTVPRGGALFSLRTGAPIIVGMCVREGIKGYRVVIGKKIEFNPTGRLKNDIINLTQLVAKEMEKKIITSPEQWYVFDMKWGKEK